MGTEDNRRTMTEVYEAIARGDGSRFVERLADDAVLVLTGDNSWSGIHRGKAAILRFFGVVARLAPGTRRTVPFAVLADGDRVAIEARGEMTTRAGAPYRNHYCLVFRLRDGKIVEMKEYLDSAYCERVLGRYPDDAPKAEPLPV
jgi:ketosteroid isomerase-like protein